MKLGLVVFILTVGLSQLNHLNGQVTSANAETDSGLSDEQISDGWISLFDGETLFGWKRASNSNWSVQKGAIVATQGEQGLLRTTSQFSDFELTLEFQCDENTNSGIFFRTSPRPKDPSFDCYELNIAPPDNPFPTGSLVRRKKSDHVIAHQDPDRWHQLYLKVLGDQVTVTVDGENEFHYRDPRPLGRGYIGLQFNHGRIAFRQIHLRPLGLQSMLDEGLTQWTEANQKESTFRCQENGSELVMNMTGGPGQLESEERYGNFIFSMRCRTNGDGLNSGVFFRCIPGEMMNGYESQIQNEMVDNNPRKPKDCGTGGIFRRTTARQIVAQDNQWFTKTIVAEGPHISVWVNGYQVTDWSDTRNPHPNPRKGRRLDAGTLILQGHDPTTDIDFADLKIVELKERWLK